MLNRVDPDVAKLLNKHCGGAVDLSVHAHQHGLTSFVDHRPLPGQICRRGTTVQAISGVFGEDVRP